jgi:hypothetical protein
MVTATASPSTLRVSFTYDEGHTSQFEVVCLVRPCFEGIDILYSHHLQRFRNVARGPWVDEKVIVMQLTPSLIGLVQQGIMLELFSKFGSKIRSLEEASPQATHGNTRERLDELEGRRKSLEPEA